MLGHAVFHIHVLHHQHDTFTGVFNQTRTIFQNKEEKVDIPETERGGVIELSRLGFRASWWRKIPVEYRQRLMEYKSWTG